MHFLICCKFDQNLVIRWHHFQSSKVVHQDESLALPHCLGLPYWLCQLVSGWFLYQPESHQLSFNMVCLFVCFRQFGHIDRTRRPGSDKNPSVFIFSSLSFRGTHPNISNVSEIFSPNMIILYLYYFNTLTLNMIVSHTYNL